MVLMGPSPPAASHPHGALITAVQARRDGASPLAGLGLPALAPVLSGRSTRLPGPGETALIIAAGLAAGGQVSLPLRIGSHSGSQRVARLLPLRAGAP